MSTEFLAPFVIEIGMEEMPAGAMPGVAKTFEDQAIQFFTKERLEPAHLRFGATCRRLVMMADSVLIRQEDRVVLQKGPPEKFLKDANGAFSKQAEGFAKKFNKAPEEITIKDGYLSLAVEERGRAATDLLGQFINQFLETCPLPKRMTWGDEFTFLRPVRWVLGLVGSEVVAFQSKLIKAGHFTHEPRAFGSKPIALTQAGLYEDTMQRLGVILSPKKRNQHLHDLVTSLLKNRGVSALTRDSEELLEEINWLVETPTAALASFDSTFLSVPPEVVRVVLMRHQRYLPLVADEGNRQTYSNQFVVVLDRPGSANLTDSLLGHEKVVAARLSDAHFFWEADRKNALDSHERRDKMAGIVWHPKLGSLLEKQERVSVIAQSLVASGKLDKLTGKEDFAKAAWLYRFDRTTTLVGEFPELEGAVGARIVADQEEGAGHGPLIAQGMGLQKGAGQVAYEPGIPKESLGALLLVLDRLDTLVNFFAAGMVPTATEDPFALRRAGIQLLQPLVQGLIPLSLGEIISTTMAHSKAAQSFSKGANELQKLIEGFLEDRLENVLLDQNEGASTPQIRAALKGNSIQILLENDQVKLEHLVGESLAQTNSRLQGLLTQFKVGANLKNITEAAIRAQNISAGRVSETLSLKPPEWTQGNEAWQNLHAFANKWARAISEDPGTQSSWEFPEEGADLVHAFFEKVMVNDEDLNKREQNLTLVGSIGLLYGQLADFRELKTLLGNL